MCDNDKNGSIDKKELSELLESLVDIAKSQDAEVGDGTTSVVVLACEFLKQCKPFVEEVSLSLHPFVRE